MKVSIFFTRKPDGLPQDAGAAIKRFYDEVSSCGISRVIAPLLTNYPSRIIPGGNDRWNLFLDLAEKKGLPVYGELPCFYGYNRLGVTTDKVYQPGVSPEVLARKFIWPIDNLMNWRCPSYPENHWFVLDILREFLDAYSPAGIFLDLVRYPNSDILREFPCLCEKCRARRAAWLGHEVFTPAELSDPAVQFHEIRSRCETVRRFVETARRLTEERKVKLCLFARARYLEDALCEGQDWVDWCGAGFLDIIAPMSYTQTFGWHISQLARVVAYHHHLLADKSVEFNEALAKDAELGALSPAALKSQIRAVHAAGVAGAVLWGALQPDDYAMLSECISADEG